MASRARVSLGWRLSVATAVLMAVQSAGGLFVGGVYRDEHWIRLTWLGNDAVTLLLAVPTLAIALWLVRRGSERARLVWYSVLGYAVYNYAYYLYGARLNVLFPICVATVFVSALALMTELASLDVGALAARFSPRTPVRAVGGYMLFTGIGLGGTWLAMWAGYVFAGVQPPVEEPAFRLIISLDWTYVIPFYLLGGMLLMRRHAWGYVLGTMMNVKGALVQVPVWGGWTVLSVVALVLLLRGLRKEPAPASRTAA